MAPLRLDLARYVSSHEGERVDSTVSRFTPTRLGERGLRSLGLSNPGENLVRGHQPLLAGTGEVHPNSRPAGTAELPTRVVEAGRGRQVGRMGGLHPVGEREALGAGSWVPEAHLAPRLQVERVVIKRTRRAARDQLRDGRELALAHGRLQVGPRLAM